MNDTFGFQDDPINESALQFGQPTAARPTFVLLAVAVVLVGAASLFAWSHTEFSLDNRAHRGDAEAQYLLGKHYFDQALSPGDYRRAAALIGRSAQQGYAKAQTALGLLYENGLGVTKDYSQASQWLRRAADQGFPVAQNELGIMFAKGRGAARNLDQAVGWFRLAAAQGSEVARRNLALIQVAQARVIPELTTSSKKTYKHVQLQRLDADGATVSFRPVPGGMGVARLSLENLPEALQDLCHSADQHGIASDSAYSQLGGITSIL